VKYNQQQEINDFLNQLKKLSIEDFEKVRQHAISYCEIQISAERLLRLGAADFNWLDKKARDAVRPVIMDPNCPARLGYRLSSLILDATQAIVHRGNLTREQYDAVVGGFRQVGVTVPSE
jgi:hypothetical protein